MKISLVVLLLSIACYCYSFDIVGLQNGENYKGKILNVDSSNVEFSAKGKRFVIPADSIKFVVLGKVNKRNYRLGVLDTTMTIKKRAQADMKVLHGRKFPLIFASVAWFPVTFPVLLFAANPQPHQGKNVYMSDNYMYFTDPEYLEEYRKYGRKQMLKTSVLSFLIFAVTIVFVS